MSKEIKSEVIRLKTEDGYWLAQVVITSNHGLYIDSDYGNFVYRWSETGENFKKFLLRINSGYLTTKLYPDYAYIFGSLSKKQKEGVERMINKILPALQDYLKEQAK